MARACVRARDTLGTIQALEALGETAGLNEGAGWLAAGTALAYPSPEAAVTQRLESLAHGTLPRVARRALAAHALRMGDTVAVMSSLNDAPEDTYNVRDRAVIGALAGAEPSSLEKWLEPLDRDPEWGCWPRRFAPLSEARAARPTSRAKRTSGHDLPTPRSVWVGCSRPEQFPTTSNKPFARWKRRHLTFRCRVLGMEIDMETGRVDRLADALSKQGSEGANDARDRALMAGLLYEVAQQTLRARELYTIARTADPSCEAAVRAELFVSPPSESANLLSRHEASLDDARASALIVLEAAHSTGDDPESYSRLLKEAHDKAPPPLRGLARRASARARGEFDTIVEWLRERRGRRTIAVEQAYDLVREALLIADRDLDDARELLEQRLARDRAISRCASSTSDCPPSLPPTRPHSGPNERSQPKERPRRLSLFAAIEYERGGNFEQAARLAQASLEAEDSPLTRLCAERNETKGGSPPTWPSAHRAGRTTEDIREPASRRTSDWPRSTKSRGATPPSAVLWHQSILEERPGYLPSLSRLEHGSSATAVKTNSSPSQAGSRRR